MLVHKGRNPGQTHPRPTPFPMGLAGDPGLGF